jgi:hypothetical protein
MNATARYSLTDAYFREAYDQWIRYVARWRRWAPYFTLLLLGCGSLFAALGCTLAAAIALVAGVVEFADIMTHRRKWIAARREGCRFDKEIRLTFTNDAMAYEGPFSSGHLQWAGIERVKATPKGLFLYPQAGMHIYIPDSGLEPASAKQEIIARVASGA